MASIGVTWPDKEELGFTPRYDRKPILISIPTGFDRETVTVVNFNSV